MKQSFFIFWLSIFLAFFLSGCSRQVKPGSPVPFSEKKAEAVTNTDFSHTNIQEPTKEEERKIKITINFDGKWRKKTTGSKAVIIIKGKDGKITGANGGWIPITVKYLNETTVKILESDYNPKYLSNWFPENIAEQIYLNNFIRKTYSILRIIDENTLRGTSFAWQVSHNFISVQKIEPLVESEEWLRIKDEETNP